MTRVGKKVLDLLQLARVPLMFTAISNAWLVIFINGSEADPVPSHMNPALGNWPLWADLLLGLGVAAGLHTYGVALNDMLDARHDRVFSPSRPIAAGGLGHTAGIVMAVLSLLAALTASVFLGQGAMLLTALAAAVILFFNAIGKFLPAVGILLIALIRALFMFIPNAHIGFAWPMLLAMTHVLVCWSLAYRLEGKRPRIHAQEWWLLIFGWAFWAMALVTWMTLRDALIARESQNLWVGVLVAIALFVLAAFWVLHGHTRPIRSRRAAGASFLRLAMLWLIVYDIAWLLGAGLYWRAACNMGLLIGAIGSVRLIQVLGHFTAPPPKYRVEPVLSTT